MAADSTAAAVADSMAAVVGFMAAVAGSTVGKGTTMDPLSGQLEL